MKEQRNLFSENSLSSAFARIRFEMFSYLQLLFNFLIFVFCVVFFITKKPHNFPKGPRGFPIINNLLILTKLKYCKFHHILWYNLSKIYGPVLGLKIFNKNFVVISGKLMVKNLYRHENLQGR